MIWKYSRFFYHIGGYMQRNCGTNEPWSPLFLFPVSLLRREATRAVVAGRMAAEVFGRLLAALLSCVAVFYAGAVSITGPHYGAADSNRQCQGRSASVRNFFGCSMLCQPVWRSGRA